MSYHIRMPLDLNLRTFADAEAYYLTIQPIRSSKNADVRPLFGGDMLNAHDRRSGRRKHYMNMRKEGENIIARLCRTDVVTFRPDDSIVVHFAGWQTQSTNEFVCAVLGTYITSYAKKAWLINR